MSANTEKLAQQEIFRVHGDVGLEFALPPAIFALQGHKRVDCVLQGVLDVTIKRRRWCIDAVGSEIVEWPVLIELAHWSLSIT